MNIIDLEAWHRFLSGHWQRERPTQPGAYPTADRDGHLNGYDRIFLCREPDTQELKIIPIEWAGWWWSEPIPQLPRPPPWGDAP